MDLFSQSLVVPQNLRFYLHRLADNAQPSTNILRVNALNSATATSGGLIIVRLPMALVDLNTFAMHFETSTTDGAPSTTISGSGDQGFHAILPKGIESLISRLEVSVNGLGLLNLQQYNLLFALLKDSHQHLDKILSRTQLQNEKDMCPLNAAAVNASATPSITASSELVPITVTNWSATGGGTANTPIVVTCTTTTSQPLPATGTVYEVAYFPATTFFGYSGATALASKPAITQINTLTPAYNTTGGAVGSYVSSFQLSYTPGSGQTLSVSGPVSGTVPFNLYLQTTQSAVNGTAVLPFLKPNNNNFHSIHDWLSFFKAQPEWIQTQMLGEIEVRITLAQNTVLGMTPPCLPFSDPVSITGVKPGLLPNYSLNNIYFSIRTCSFDNNFVDDMLHHKLSSGGELEIPYDNYFNINQVQSGGSSQTRFSVNTQSLNKVLGVNRLSGFDSPAGMMTIVPAGLGLTYCDRLGMVNKSPYFTTSASHPSGATYGQVVDPSSFNYWQYQVNNAFIPNYKISPVNNFFFNQEMYDMHNDWASGTLAGTPTVYMNSNYQMGIALDFMDSEIPRLVSGVDTRGAVSVAYLNQDNNLNGDRTDIFTCFTSILRVGANQQVQVVY